MNISKTRIVGSNYVGLFGITNDNICLLPPSTEEKTLKEIEKTLEVKTIKTTIYSSPLLAVFAKMNNKHAYIPGYAQSKELETIEKEIKVKILQTENALGNLMEVNDKGAIISKIMPKKICEEIKKTGLQIMQMNIGKIDVVGSCLVATNKGFLASPNASMEEAQQIEKTLEVKGGSSTANTGDYFIRNSILANTKGIILGENTTPHEINRIEEALTGEA
jgi:translation initiation factor 6